MSDREAFYASLREKLIETTTFPSKYLYKFIVPSGEEKVQQVQEIFNKGGAVITTRQSRTGKFTSVSIHLNVSTVDEVISYYQQAEKIEGIISL
ncbi:DUF493 family protein [uncultured Tenacibaculum sp.]|uniref:DUF493 family protein n=1 Tax=uncultured Tenacibaculum sp. TaxID=174713 RepID=UPI0026335507|nr:DUF493 family protein [uncultured Tenacibaculum sp.]